MRKLICYIAAALVLNLCACSSPAAQSSAGSSITTSAEVSAKSSAEKAAENTEQKSESEYRNTTDGYEITVLPDPFKSPYAYFYTENVVDGSVIANVFFVFPKEGHTVEEAVEAPDERRALAFIGTMVFSNEGKEVNKEFVTKYCLEPERYREIVRKDGHNLFLCEGREQDHTDMEKTTREEKDAVKAAIAKFEELAKNVVPGEIDYPRLSFKTIDINGNPVTSEECFSGNDVTLLNIWASYCGPCEKEMPSLVKAEEQLKADNCQVILCLYDTDSRDSREFQDAMALLNRTGAQNLKCILVNDEIKEQLDCFIKGVPRSFAVGSDGKIVGPEYGGDRSVESFVDWVKTHKK